MKRQGLRLGRFLLSCWVEQACDKADLEVSFSQKISVTDHISKSPSLTFQLDKGWSRPSGLRQSRLMEWL